TPRAGDAITFVDGAKKTWEALRIGADGWFTHPSLRGGYAAFTVQGDRPRVAMLEAVGHSMVYVNGEPRVGDNYALAHVHLPVLLREGDNDVLFHVGRGKLKVNLVSPRAPIFWDTNDSTLPDFVVGENKEAWASIVVANTTSTDAADLVAIAGSTESDIP